MFQIFTIRQALYAGYKELLHRVEETFLFINDAEMFGNISIYIFNSFWMNYA